MVWPQNRPVPVRLYVQPTTWPALLFSCQHSEWVSQHSVHLCIIAALLSMCVHSLLTYLHSPKAAYEAMPNMVLALLPMLAVPCPLSAWLSVSSSSFPRGELCLCRKIAYWVYVSAVTYVQGIYEAHTVCVCWHSQEGPCADWPRQELRQLCPLELVHCTGQWTAHLHGRHSGRSRVHSKLCSWTDWHCVTPTLYSTTVLHVCIRFPARTVWLNYVHIWEYCQSLYILHVYTLSIRLAAPLSLSSCTTSSWQPSPGCCVREWYCTTFSSRSSPVSSVVGGGS